MIKNSVKKLIVFALCAIFVLPFVNLTTNSVKADEYKKVFKGTEYVISVESVPELKDADSKDVEIKIEKDGGAPVVVYDGESKVVDGYTATFSASDDAATITFFNNGVHKVTIAKKEGTTKYEETFKVGDTEEFITLDYILDETKLNEYKQEVEKNAKEDLTAGTSSFTVPSLEKLISTNFPYGSIRKTVYYYTVGDTASSSNFASKADLKISIKGYGTYRFYVVFDIEKSNLNIDGGKAITVDGLKEKEDGFYACSVDGTELYFNKNDEKYYVKDNSSKGYGEEFSIAGKTVVETLKVPVFAFTLDSKEPTIKINSTYQENGFVDLEYTLPKVDVYGDILSEKYEIEYRKDSSSDWEVIDELSSGSLKFTPDKTGEYRLRVTVFGVNHVKDAYTEVIKVSKAIKSSPYKTSFGDWLEVNVFPFILFCISFACLVAIILLLVIKPKEAKVDVKEEDR